MNYVVTYKRDETGWWVASVRGVPGCHTQGRTIEEARRRIREALSLFVEDAEQATLEDRVHLPANLRRAVRAHFGARRKLRKVEGEAATVTSEVVRSLTDDLGLSVRDIGRLLDLSHGRVHQILG